MIIPVTGFATDKPIIKQLVMERSSMLGFAGFCFAGSPLTRVYD
jgi:hypothetical protein